MNVVKSNKYKGKDKDRGFLTRLDLEDIGDGVNWLVTHPLIYIARDSRRWVVPAGFRTDLASIPQLLQNLIPKTGKYNSACVLHDWLYTTQPQSPITVTRLVADNLLREAMAVSGVNLVTRRLIYWGVRVGGHWIWQHHTADLTVGSSSSGPHTLPPVLPPVA